MGTPANGDRPASIEVAQVLRSRVLVRRSARRVVDLTDEVAGGALLDALPADRSP